MARRRRKPGSRIAEQPPFFDDRPSDLPPFVSTPEEVKRAVERNAVQRGVLLVRVLVSLNMDEAIAAVGNIAAVYDMEEIREAADLLGIDPEALNLLDQAEPPIPYPYYFCAPTYLMDHPRLVMYYRNVAMLSRKVMSGIGLGTEAYELNSVAPPAGVASELAHYFNKIVSALIKTGGVTPQRHIEMAFANLGDSLGGVSRNEVGRIALAQVIRLLALHLHRKWQLADIAYRVKGRIMPDDEDAEEQIDPGEDQVLAVTPDMDLEGVLNRLESQRVKYRELTMRNGNRLLLDRQLEWQSSDGKTYRVGPDLHALSSQADMLWAGELKGGADPAGSDEHWKTATQALGRILDACEKTGRPQPDLSFIATIIVERVAREAQAWIDQGKLTSVYNLTKISENPQERWKFLDEMTTFLGCD
ncbi:MAG: hypothetical protein NT169_11545 [Chloroflexi bacterium]|nr:hypothetical protein [Chloroflexota bacterium]